MSLQDLDDLRRGRQYLRRALRGLGRAAGSKGAADRLRPLVMTVEQTLAAVDRAMAAETATLEAPHEFVQPKAGIWCVRCGGTEDRHEPPAPVMAPCEAGRARGPITQQSRRSG